MNVEPVSVDARGFEAPMGLVAPDLDSARAESLVQRINALSGKVAELEDETSQLLHRQLLELKDVLEERVRLGRADEGPEEMVLRLPPELDVIQAILSGQGISGSETGTEPSNEDSLSRHGDDVSPLIRAAMVAESLPEAGATPVNDSWADTEEENSWFRDEELEGEGTILSDVEASIARSESFDEPHQGVPDSLDAELPSEPTVDDEAHPRLGKAEPHEANEPMEELEPLEELARTASEQRRPQARAVAAVPRQLAYEAMAAPWRVEEDGMLVCMVAYDYEPPRIKALAKSLERKVSVVEVTHGEVVEALETAYGPVGGVDNDALLLSLSKGDVPVGPGGLLGHVRRWFTKT